MLALAVLRISCFGCDFSFEKAKVRQAHRDAQTIAEALDIYALVHPDAPVPAGLYLDSTGRRVAKDPWGRPYRFRCPSIHRSHGCDVWSGGKRSEGEPINSWSPLPD